MEEAVSMDEDEDYVAPQSYPLIPTHSSFQYPIWRRNEATIVVEPVHSGHICVRGLCMFFEFVRRVYCALHYA